MCSCDHYGALSWVILMILTKYVFDVSVWLTAEYSVIVGSVTLRFYCTLMK